MSQMSEMAQTIEDLRNAAATIKEAADWLAQQFSAPTEEQPAEKAPTKEPRTDELPAEEPQAGAPAEIKWEQIRAVLANKARAGHTAAICELLKQYGAVKLSQVDPKHYAAILKETEGWTDAT